MPTFQELMAFAKEVGMPWSCVGAVLAIHYKALWEMSKVQERMCASLEHIAKHISREEHDHGKG